MGAIKKPLTAHHATVLAHADTIMGTPTHSTSSTEIEWTFGVYFWRWRAVFLENANGNPGADARDFRAAIFQDGFNVTGGDFDRHDRSPTAMASGDVKSNCSFNRLEQGALQGLVAAPSRSSPKGVNAAVCCARNHCAFYVSIL